MTKFIKTNEGPERQVLPIGGAAYIPTHTYGGFTLRFDVLEEFANVVTFAINGVCLSGYFFTKQRQDAPGFSPGEEWRIPFLRQGWMGIVHQRLSLDNFCEM
jgi:hypothetical protein